jgi:A/G-specific adenine glycosylase
MPRYTQGLMDLGATVCLPRKPNCLLCPVAAAVCGAARGCTESYPVKTRKLKRSAVAVVAAGANGRWRGVAAQAPTPGVWAGLFCLPVFDSAEATVGQRACALARPLA